MAAYAFKYGQTIFEIHISPRGQGFVADAYESNPAERTLLPLKTFAAETEELALQSARDYLSGNYGKESDQLVPADLKSRTILPPVT